MVGKDYLFFLLPAPPNSITGAGLKKTAPQLLFDKRHRFSEAVATDCSDVAKAVLQ